MKYIPIFLISLIVLFLGSCGKDDTPTRIDLTTETFTSFQMTFNPIGGGDQIIFGLEDLGDVGVAMSAATGPLKANTLYDARVVLFNRKVEPNKNLTASVEEAGTDYQLFVVADPNNIFEEIEYLDTDVNGNALGLNMSFKTSERFVVGNLRFILKRNSDKSVRYVPGEVVPTGIGGETLIDANFEVIVQL